MSKYVYNLTKLREHAKKTVQLFKKAGIRTKYAVKANPSLFALSALKESGVEGWDITSPNDLLLLGDIKSVENVTLSGPAKNEDDLRLATEGVVVEVEDTRELEMLSELGVTEYAIRVRPPKKFKGFAVDMSESWFGIPLERVPSVVEFGKSLGMSVIGFHCYPGSQSLNSEDLYTYYDWAIGELVSLSSTYVETDDKVKPYINIGGGIGVPYHSGQVGVDIEKLTDRLGDRLKDLHHKYDFWVELGRYLVADSVEYVVDVMRKEKVGDKIFLITDGGMHHWSALSGNLGQIIPRNFPTRSSSDSTENEVVTVVGSLCTSIDVLARDVELPKTEVGDQIIFSQAGAYSFNASPSNFLDRPLPILEIND